MSDNMNNGFDQAASFQKLWADSFVNMAGVWSQFSPGSPPPEEMRKMRGGMLKALSESWDEYMRTPQFMEMMKASLNGALDLKRMTRDGMNRVHEQFEIPSKQDIDGVLLAIRHVEGRLLDRLEGVDDRVLNLAENIDKIDQRIAKQEKTIDERLANLAGNFDKIDQRIAKQENAIDERLANLAESIGKIDQRIAKQENAIDERLVNLAGNFGKIDQRIAKQEKTIDERLANLAESIGKIDQRIAKQKNTIEGSAQTSKTKAQKPAASTGAKESPSK